MSTIAVMLPKEVFQGSGIDRIFYDENREVFNIYSFTEELKRITREQLEYELKCTRDITLENQARYLIDWCRIHVTARTKPVSPVTPRRSRLLLLTH